jgi:hypothetical protein
VDPVDPDPQHWKNWYEKLKNSTQVKLSYKFSHAEHAPPPHLPPPHLWIFCLFYGHNCWAKYLSKKQVPSVLHMASN